MEYNAGIRYTFERKLVNGAKFHDFEIECLLDEISRLQKLHEWIPVTPETMPENNEIVLLYNRVGGDVFTAQFHQFKRYAVWYIEGEEINVINNKDEYSLWHKIELPFPPQEQP